MRTLMRTFLVVAAYLVGVAVVYWFLTEEDAGTALLLGTAATLGLVAAFLVRRTGTREMPPEDDPDADPAAAAGTAIGSFPFSSTWPVVLVAGLVLTALGVLYTVILIPMGLTVTTVAIVGLMRESPT